MELSSRFKRVVQCDVHYRGHVRCAVVLKYPQLILSRRQCTSRHPTTLTLLALCLKPAFDLAVRITQNVEHIFTL
jgi:hypothetical protein